MTDTKYSTLSLNMQKEIKIYGHEFVTADGRKFVKYVTKSNDGVYYDVKFTKSCLLRPSLNKNYLVKFDSLNSFIKHTDKFNSILVIRSVDSINELVYNTVDTVAELF